MSIHGQIASLVASGKLTLLLPFGQRVRRRVYAATEVVELLGAPAGQHVVDDVRRGHAMADIDWFIGGHHIDMRFATSRTVHARLAQLEPPVDNVWEFRIREPSPGIRIFGAFVETDTFVATNWRTKEQLLDADGKENVLRYRHAMEECKTRWIEFFAPAERLSGVNAHDYISKNVTDLGRP